MTTCCSSELSCNVTHHNFRDIASPATLLPKPAPLWGSLFEALLTPFFPHQISQVMTSINFYGHSQVCCTVAQRGWGLSSRCLARWTKLKSTEQPGSDSFSVLPVERERAKAHFVWWGRYTTISKNRMKACLEPFFTSMQSTVHYLTLENALIRSWHWRVMLICIGQWRSLRHLITRTMQQRFWSRFRQVLVLRYTHHLLPAPMGAFQAYICTKMKMKIDNTSQISGWRWRISGCFYWSSPWQCICPHICINPSCFDPPTLWIAHAPTRCLVISISSFWKALSLVLLPMGFGWGNSFLFHLPVHWQTNIIVKYVLFWNNLQTYK